MKDIEIAQAAELVKIREIAKKMMLPSADVVKIYYVALLHDVGKISIPDAILNKPLPLTEDEQNMIKKSNTVESMSVLGRIKPRGKNYTVAAKILTYFSVASSRQRSYDWLRCEGLKNEMEM